MGDILRVFVIVAGAYMFLKAILSLAKRKMTEPFCLAWAFLAALMVLAGILLNPVQLDNFISFRGLILVILVISGLLWDLWFISSQHLPYSHTAFSHSPHTPMHPALPLRSPLRLNRR